MTWNRTAGSRTDLCIRCGQQPPAKQKRRCKQCLAEMEADRRVRRNEQGDDGRPCATEGCEKPRYRVPSQYSSYCYEHHLAIRRKCLIKWQYGLSPEEYEALRERAGYACQACRSTRRLVVDHCHETGVVRGILCTECNTSLGSLHDDVDRILSLAAYLMSGRDVLPVEPSRQVVDDTGTGRTTA